MNWEFVFKLTAMVYMLSSGALNAYLWFKARTDKRFEHIDTSLERVNAEAEADREVVRLAIAERRAHVSDLRSDVEVIKARMRQAPTHEDLYAIKQGLAAVDERSRILLDGMRRIENHLLER